MGSHQLSKSNESLTLDVMFWPVLELALHVQSICRAAVLPPLDAVMRITYLGKMSCYHASLPDQPNSSPAWLAAQRVLCRVPRISCLGNLLSRHAGVGVGGLSSTGSWVLSARETECGCDSAGA